MMDLSINVVIVMSRCVKTKQDFGIRFEERSKNQWVGDWTFAIQQALAKKEGYDRGEIKGSFDFDNSYPGCPYCKNSSIVLCSCGKVGCWDRVLSRYTCPWCGLSAEISGQITSLDAGVDR